MNGTMVQCLECQKIMYYDGFLASFDTHDINSNVYLYIFMVFIGHVVSVERSKTAYNSLHIDCIGFMS